MESEINYSISEYEGIKVIKLVGNISNSTKIEFENLVNRLTQKNNVIVNMKEVSVITSGGIKSLVNVSVEARNRKKRVMIMGLREGLVKMMEIMDILQYITFVDSTEEGLSKAQLI